MVMTRRGGAQKRRNTVLNDIIKDPCALDLIVWAGSPMIWPVVERIFEACVLTEPPIRWALLGPSEQELTRALRRLHTSMQGIPEFLMPDTPRGPRPYTLQVTLQEEEILSRLISRSTVFVYASELPLPRSLLDSCYANLVDLIDAGSCETTAASQNLKLQILGGTPRRSGGVIHLGIGKKNHCDGLPLGVVLEDHNGSGRAVEAVALLKSLIDSHSLVAHTWPNNASLDEIDQQGCAARSRL